MTLANALCFDCETYRATDPAALAWLERKKPKNKTLENHIADSAKNPMTAKLLCVCIKTDDAEWSFNAMEQPVEDALTAFSEVVDGIIDGQTVITGYNIKHFDLPLMLMQFQRYQIEPPKHWPVYNGRYWRGRIHDSMERMPGCTPPNMGEACAMYGITGKKFMIDGQPIDGSHVGALFDAGRYMDIIDYCESDVDAEYELYQRQTFNGNWGAYDDGNTELRDVLSEIHGNSGMSNGAKWLTALPALKSARLITGQHSNQG